MGTAAFTYRLKPGVSADVYEAWIRDFDFPHVALIPSVTEITIIRVEGAVMGDKKPYDYLEIIEYTTIDAFLNDLRTNPNAHAIGEQVGQYVEFLTNSFGEPVGHEKHTCMPDILHKLTIDAPPELVLSALTEQEGLGGWWTEDVLASPAVGSIAEFGFENRSVVNRMKVVAITPQRVEWECLAGPTEWLGTTLTFDLEPAPNGQTTVRFAHRGWKEASDFFAHCNNKWGYFLASLKSLLEHGKGTPDPAH